MPKRHIKDLYSLGKEDLPLIEHMRTVSQQLVAGKGARIIDHTEEASSNGLVMGFHKPLSTSIDHLHLHVFQMPWTSPWLAMRKYNWLFFERVEETVARVGR